MEKHTALSLVKRFRQHNKKSLGQHFLIDEHTIDAILHACTVFGAKRYVEIGPGAAALTHRLVELGQPVVALEKDRRCVAFLKQTLPHPNLDVIETDVLEDPWPEALTQAQPKTLWVSNLPYNIATPILFRIIDDQIPLQAMILMFQYEVGKRLAATAGTKAYNALSVIAQLYFDIHIITKIGPKAFIPPPKVDSVLLRLTPRPQRFASHDEALAFRALVRAAFSQRRKTMANALAGYLGRNKNDWQQQCVDMGWQPDVRAQSLSLDAFLALYDKLPKRSQP